MNWIGEHWDTIIEIVTIGVGLAWLGWKNYRKWQEAAEDSFWIWVGSVALDELRRLAGIAKAGLTEEFVKDKAAFLWVQLGGNPEFADGFGDFVWNMWRAIVDSSEEDADKGVIDGRWTYSGMIETSRHRALLSQ